MNNKVLKYIGAVCLALWNGYHHPINTKMDFVMIVLFWIGVTCFVNGYVEDDK